MSTKPNNIPHPMSDDEVARAKRRDLMPKLIVVIGLPCIAFTIALATMDSRSGLTAMGLVCILVLVLGVIALGITRPASEFDVLVAGDLTQLERQIGEAPETRAEVARWVREGKVLRKRDFAYALDAARIEKGVRDDETAFYKLLRKCTG